MVDTLCKKHGRTGITLACPHVHRAYEADEAIAFTWVDVGWGGTPICAPCVATRPPQGASEDALLTWSFSLEWRPACRTCFAGWEAAQGRPAR